MSSLQESHQVQVAVYDLSHGMARSLSAQFLGPNHQIDAIPHTAVIVYCREYFFGGGIQSEEPAAFRRMTGILPIQVLDMGRTHVSKAAFEAWCRQKMDSGEFSMESYDLMHHNCNTFTHFALTQGLRMSQGVPQWILDVPRKFLSSPMGQMVRPMLDNMQLGRVQGAQTMSSAAPFATAAPMVTAAAPNPWAQMPAAAPVSEASTATTTATTRTTTSREILNKHNKPLLANETKTVSMCAEKLVPLMTGDAETQDMRQAAKSLVQQIPLPAEHATRVADLLLRCLETGQKSTFCLMLLRLLVLQNAEQCQACLQWITTDLPTAAAAARAMAWLTLANVAAQASHLLDVESLVEHCLADISPKTQSRAEVRQAAVAFVYNTVIVNPTSETTEALSDQQVSILCACLDSLDDESDETVRFRRILAAARLLWPVGVSQRHEATAQLIQDLGFQEGLESLANEKETQSAKLAQEVLSILME